jgi:hypothetical protein
MAAEMALDIRHHGLTPFDPQRPKPLVQQLELPAKSLTLGPATDGKVAASATRDEVREAKKVKRLGATQPITMTTPRGIAAKSQHRRLRGLDFQLKCRKALLQSLQETRRVCLVLKTRNEVVRKAHYVRLASARLDEASLKPEIQYVMQIDV